MQRRREEEAWIPRTKLGQMVQAGQIISMSDIFTQGLKIKEPEIVDTLLQPLKQEVLGISLVQKQTDAGEKSHFKALVAIGDEGGYVGLGAGKAAQVRAAIDKATFQAKLNIIPVKRGCGSWECRCDQVHSVPFKIQGHCGSVKVEVMPGPRGLGLVGSEVAQTILQLAGIKDCWTRSYGSTGTITSTAMAIFDALRNTYRIITQEEWAG
ncbi:30S ribosomal protein S5 [[Eubacterium] cellulosolvens]